MTESAAIASPVPGQVEEEVKKLEPVVEQPFVKVEEEALVSPVLDQVEEESKQEPVLKQPIANEKIPVQQPNEQEEEKSGAASDGNTQVINREPVYYRHALGNFLSYEFGLQHEDQNVKIEILSGIQNFATVKITIDGTEYDSEKHFKELTQTPYEFVH